MGTYIGTTTKYTELYNTIYGKFAKQRGYKISNKFKIIIMDRIFTNIPENEAIAVKILSKGYTYDQAAKLAKMDKKVLLKSYDLAMKHLMSPKNISIAVHNYYKVRKKKVTKFTEADFGGRKYIITALERSGITCREQLYMHLDNGWYYLWTIPGCGDAARQAILKAIDTWDER